LILIVNNCEPVPWATHYI